QYLAPLLADHVRLVRIDAAQTLANVPKETLTENQHQAIQRGVAEYIAAEMTNADRPESYLNIGLIHIDQGRFDQAEAAYRAALNLQPAFTQAAVNLADLYRIQGRDEDGEKVLRQALELDPRNATAHHALGLLLIRQKRLPEALSALAEAARFGEDNARYGYVYAVALNSAGQGSKAIQELETVLAKHPNDRETLMALVAFQRHTGNLGAARDYARRLATLEPENPEVRALLQQVEATR
ncbi:MAG: tetratricopeptide repeat protein, partial [Candidatus Contendobacter sp.]|nr:tetratricopeptide repeat protein [Candidatus Contendobacter sp.]